MGGKSINFLGFLRLSFGFFDWTSTRQEMENIIVLEDKFFIAEIKTKGAELCRLFCKKTKTEILWNGDATYWGRHAPVLFPIVGKVKNNQYQINEKSYELSQHGFARDAEFLVINQSKTSCSLQITSTKNTLKKYPFEFSFTTTFTLNSTGLTTNYDVINTGTSPSLFSLGAHPAFNCPLNDDLKLTDYELKLEKKETVSILLLAKSGLISDERSPFLTNENSIPLNDKLFINDALIFDDLKSQSLTIQSQKDDVAVKVSWYNFPHLGIWKPLKAPFICIEPWHGMADFDSQNGGFQSKFGIIELDPTKKFSAGYSVETLV